MIAPEYAPATREAGLKCDDDVGEAMQRNMAMVSGGIAMAQVSLMGAAGAIGSAAGAWLAVVDNAPGGGGATPEQVADELWHILRPMVRRSIVRARERSK